MENVKLNDFVDFNCISTLNFSPDKENAAFVLHKPDLNNNKYNANIWIYNVKNKKINKLTALDDARSYMWINNEEIMFSAMRKE